MSVPELSQPIQIKPIINYPREAQTGQTYLMSIDVQLASPDASWPYPDEEYPITFILNTQPYFRYEPLNGEREPGVVLHRFGGTYGPAQYLLTASEQAVKSGHISITFVNGWGLPMTYLELECSVKAEAAPNKEQEITVPNKGKALVVPQTSSGSEEEKPSREEIQSSHKAIEAVQNSQAADEETYGSQETAEERTRRFELIAKQLEQTGWALYQFTDDKLVSYFSARNREEGIAVAGHPNIPDGYMLFIARKLVGIIKTRAIGVPLTSREATETLIATMESLLSISIIRTGYSTLPFFYGTTDGETLFTNYLEPESQSRRVFTFHRPETLARWLEQAPPNVPTTQNNLLRSRLQRMPTLQRQGLREHQFEAINNLERSLAQNHRYALIQMYTGTGITFAGLNIIHRLLKYGGVRRILYALDTPIAKNYVINVLQEFVSSEGGAKLIDLYDIDYLQSNTLDPDASICIATLEEFYRAFIADFFANTSEKISRTSTFRVNAVYPEAVYSWTLPIEYFDVIVLANWDSHLHQTWQPFLDYFDAFIVGSTGVVDEQLVSLFGGNLVYQQEVDLPHALILTVSPEEYGAVRTQMGKIEQEANTDTVYEQSVFATEQGAWRVGLAQIVGVPERSAFEAGRVISNFNPRVVLLVGTARGVQGMAPGAVVFATKVFSYDQSQEKPFILRTEVSGSSEALVERARVEARRREWLQRIPPHNSPSEVTPRVFFGPIVDGSILPEFFTFSDLPHTTEILKSDMLAVDTTVESFLQALDRNPQVQFAIIRGIDGLLDESRRRQWPQAAQYAAAFAFELLAKLNPEDFAPKDEPEPEAGGFEILCLFSRKDMRLANQLAVHLKPLMEQGYITLNNIAIENFPFPDIREHINKARVILLLLSADLFNVDPLWDDGIPLIMRRFEAEELAVIPILLRPVLWDDTPFDRFVALPRDGSWIAQSSGRDRDKAFTEIAQEIESLIEKLTSPVPDEARKVVASLREFLEQNNNKVFELEASLSQTDTIHPAIIAGLLVDGLRKIDLSLEEVWDAYWQIEPSLQVCGLDERRTTSDIVSLISYTRQQDYDKFARLEPFRDIVSRRFNNWMTKKWWQESDLPIDERKPRFNEEQVRWLERIRDYIAMSLRCEQQDFDRPPFSSDGGLATARNLFGSELPSILNELNITLVADSLQGKEFSS